MKLKVWFLETRPQFLLLTVALVFLGTSVAWYDGFFSLGLALLAFVGLLLSHISVNVLNDYFDFRSGVDLATRRTPFSGGSGILPASLLKPGQVLWLGIGSFLLAMAIGVYFIFVSGMLLLPLLLVGGICILFYTPVILKSHWPEWSPGVGLGALPILGAYFVQTFSYSIHALFAAIIPGILVHNLLLLNEFPDTDADGKAYRKTLPITMGKRGASIFYSAMTVMVYLWVVIGVAVGQMPIFSLLALLTLPMAIKAIQGARHYDDMNKLVPGMANNVMVVLLTQLLLGIGYIISGSLNI